MTQSNIFRPNRYFRLRFIEAKKKQQYLERSNHSKYVVPSLSSDCAIAELSQRFLKQFRRQYLRRNPSSVLFYIQPER